MVVGCEDPPFRDRLEIVEIWDTSEELDPLLLVSGFVDDLRGGKAGDDSEEFVRPGRGGGAFRTGRTGSFSETESDVIVR